MTRLNARILTVSLLMIFLLAACNFPSSPTVSPAGPNVAYTAAAETIAAKLTQVSIPGTVTPTPRSSANSQGTLVPVATGQNSSGTAAPTLLPTPVKTPTPTVTEAPTATTVANDPREKLGKPNWKDNFTSSDNWPLFDDTHVTMKVANGQLFMTALNADKWNSWMMTSQALANFYLEGTASPEACSGLDHYGLIVHAPDQNQGYLYAFSCDGQYSLIKWNGKFSVRLVDWTHSDLIQAGANKTNRLGVMAQDNKLSLYANGNLLTEVVDNSYKIGGFGVLIGAAETPGFTAAFDQIQYWILP